MSVAGEHILAILMNYSRYFPAVAWRPNQKYLTKTIDISYVMLQFVREAPVVPVLSAGQPTSLRQQHHDEDNIATNKDHSVDS